jgi:hypothetical protein
MAAVTEAPRALPEASRSTCRCTQCGGTAKLWSDRWVCRDCGYFDFVAVSSGANNALGQWEETETFDRLVEKTHFWARHAQAGGGSQQMHSLAHCALSASRALKILASKLRLR